MLDGRVNCPRCGKRVDELVADRGICVDCINYLHQLAVDFMADQTIINSNINYSPEGAE